MSHKFYKAEKIINGERQVVFDPTLGKDVYATWDVPDEYIPSANCKVVEFKAPIDMAIPSNFKGVMGAANEGLNNMANKLNDIFNGTNSYKRNINYSDNFNNVVIHTGLQVDLAPDEVLLITSCPNTNGVSIAGGSLIIPEGKEIELPMFNTRPFDTHVSRGDVVAHGIFLKLNTENSGDNSSNTHGDSVNLGKD